MVTMNKFCTVCGEDNFFSITPVTPNVQPCKKCGEPLSVKDLKQELKNRRIAWQAKTIESAREGSSQAAVPPQPLAADRCVELLQGIHWYARAAFWLFVAGLAIACLAAIL